MGKRTNKTTTSANLPGFLGWPASKQAKQIGATAGSFLENPYTGDWRAPVNATMLGGNAWAKDAANTLKYGGGGEALYNLGVDTAKGKYLDLASNPVFSEYLQSGIVDPISKVYSERLRPELQGQNVLANTFDNLRYGIESAKMTADEADLVRQASSEATMGLYNAERDRQMLADQLINSGAAQLLLPGTVRSAAGEQERQIAQEYIDTELANRYGQLTEQDRIIASLLPLMQAYAGTSTTTPGINKAASTAQGAMGGASLGSSMGAVGTIIGALLGGAGGYFG